jgi:hypothetical protein
VADLRESNWLQAITLSHFALQGRKTLYHLRHRALNLLREAAVHSAVRDYMADHSLGSVGDGTFQHRNLVPLQPDIERIALVREHREGTMGAGSGAEGAGTNLENAS